MQEICDAYDTYSTLQDRKWQTRNLVPRPGGSRANAINH